MPVLADIVIEGDESCGLPNCPRVGATTKRSAQGLNKQFKRFVSCHSRLDAHVRGGGAHRDKGCF
jgi:hypothetical protein